MDDSRWNKGEPGVGKTAILLEMANKKGWKVKVRKPIGGRWTARCFRTRLPKFRFSIDTSYKKIFLQIGHLGFKVVKDGIDPADIRGLPVVYSDNESKDDTVVTGLPDTLRNRPIPWILKNSVINNPEYLAEEATRFTLGDNWREKYGEGGEAIYRAMRKRFGINSDD